MAYTQKQLDAIHDFVDNYPNPIKGRHHHSVLGALMKKGLLTDRGTSASAFHVVGKKKHAPAIEIDAGRFLAAMKGKAVWVTETKYCSPNSCCAGHGTKEFILDAEKVAGFYVSYVMAVNAESYRLWPESLDRDLDAPEPPPAATRNARIHLHDCKRRVREMSEWSELDISYTCRTVLYLGKMLYEEFENPKLSSEWDKVTPNFNAETSEKASFEDTKWEAETLGFATEEAANSAPVFATLTVDVFY